MDKERISYHFEEVSNCEMCGDPTTKHKILGQRLNTTQGMRPWRKIGIAVTVRKCSNCRLVYASPQPIPYDIQDHYGIPPEKYWHTGYFEVEPGYFSGEINKAKELIDFKTGMRSLDIGAGIGKCMIAMKESGFDAWGFEPSKPYYERALSKMNIPADRLRLGMLEEMEYEPASFDLIVFGAVFEHFYHPASCLEKAFHWLKPGGVIHIEVPSSKYLVGKLMNFYYRLIGTNYISNLSPMHVPFHLYEFSLDSFKALSAKLGYKIRHHEYHVGKTVILSRLVRVFLNRYMKWTHSGMQLTVFLSK